jgi:hypothetical protein
VLVLVVAMNNRRDAVLMSYGKKLAIQKFARCTCKVYEYFIVSVLPSFDEIHSHRPVILLGSLLSGY